MSRYFMHLVDSSDVTLHPDGMEMAPERIPGEAVLAARDCMAGDVKKGVLDFHYRIDVHNETGDMVHSLAFRDALRVFGL